MFEGDLQVTTPPPQGNPFAPGQPQAPQQPQVPQQPQGQNPYAQGQPAAPQQAGQPGFPPQGGAPFPGAPIPPGAPVPPSAPSGRFKKALRIVALILVAVAIGIGKWYFSQSDAETTAVGNCMHNDGTQTSPDLKTVDCSSGDAQYKVVEKFDNSTDSGKCEAVKDAEISYWQQGDGHNVVLCLKEV
ncbi:putative protein OS=Streptomyces fumanus OX=67302 GN=GCM10018772_12710 PE=4 SV=1 [Streptomyces fumanus]